MEITPSNSLCLMSLTHDVKQIKKNSGKCVCYPTASKQREKSCIHQTAVITDDRNSCFVWKVCLHLKMNHPPHQKKKQSNS